MLEMCCRGEAESVSFPSDERRRGRDEERTTYNTSPGERVLEARSERDVRLVGRSRSVLAEAMRKNRSATSFCSLSKKKKAAHYTLIDKNSTTGEPAAMFEII